MRFGEGVLVLTEENVLGKLSRAVTKMVPFIGNKKAAKSFVQGEVLPALGVLLQTATRFVEALRGIEAGADGTGEADVPKSVVGKVLNVKELNKLKKAIEQFFGQYADHSQFGEQPFPIEQAISKAWTTLEGALNVLWRYELERKQGRRVAWDKYTAAATTIQEQARLLGALFRETAGAL